MSATNRTRQVLSLLLSLGVAGASTALATAQAKALPASSTGPSGDAQAVAQRLASIREAAPTATEIDEAPSSEEAKVLLAQWVNFNVGGGGIGWRNGGWGNGGWGNGGWHNWGNGGWGNGGWHNWGNGGWGNGGWHNWGNGWHNFWHNA